MTNEEAKQALDKAFFILEHGSGEGLKEYLEAIKIIKENCVPVVHAQWIDESGTIVCSHCKHKRNTAEQEYTKYCGHCGAKMGDSQ